MAAVRRALGGRTARAKGLIVSSDDVFCTCGGRLSCRLKTWRIIRFFQATTRQIFCLKKTKNDELTRTSAHKRVNLISVISWHSCRRRHLIRVNTPDRYRRTKSRQNRRLMAAVAPTLAPAPAKNTLHPPPCAQTFPNNRLTSICTLVTFLFLFVFFPLNVKTVTEVLWRPTVVTIVKPICSRVFIGVFLELQPRVWRCERRRNLLRSLGNALNVRFLTRRRCNDFSFSFFVFLFTEMKIEKCNSLKL